MEMKNKRKYFPFYAYDFITDDKVICMDNEEVGIYIKLLCHQWIHRKLPADMHKLQNMCNASSEKIEYVLDECFLTHQDGWYTNERLEEIRVAMDKKLDKYSSSGKKGMASRWGKERDNDVITDKDNDLITLEKNRIEEKYNIYIVEVINYLNKKTNRSFLPTSSANQRLIAGRLREGRTVEDMKKVIDIKVAEWGKDKNYSKYLRPETLFSATKFESYVNQDPIKKQERPKTWEENMASLPKN